MAAPVFVAGKSCPSRGARYTDAAAEAVTIDTSNALVAMVVQNIKDNEPRLVAQLASLEAWVALMVARYLGGVATAAK